jgi:hypothetical protein
MSTVSEREAGVTFESLKKWSGNPPVLSKYAGILAPRRDERGDRDHAVDGAEQLAGCGHDRWALGCTHFGTLKRQVSGIDTLLLPVWQMVNVG